MLPGSSEKPTFPLNLIADFGGGGLACAVGILLALIERGNSGRGQVVNIDMVSSIVSYFRISKFTSTARSLALVIFPLSHSLASLHCPPFSATIVVTISSTVVHLSTMYIRVKTVGGCRLAV
jgi:hypothetical protein